MKRRAYSSFKDRSFSSSDEKASAFALLAIFLEKILASRNGKNERDRTP
jgi:hypothetical protein